MQKWIMALAILLVEPTLGQSSDSMTAFAAARENWRSASATNYVYGYNKFCECHGEDPPETSVTVKDGVVIAVAHQLDNSSRLVPAAPRNLSLYWTIDDIFELIESALARDAVVRAHFDKSLGYPLSVYIDYMPNLIGDEVDIRLTRYEAS